MSPTVLSHSLSDFFLDQIASRDQSPAAETALEQVAHQAHRPASAADFLLDQIASQGQSPAAKIALDQIAHQAHRPLSAAGFALDKIVRQGQSSTAGNALDQIAREDLLDCEVDEEEAAILFQSAFRGKKQRRRIVEGIAAGSLTAMLVPGTQIKRYPHGTVEGLLNAQKWASEKLE